MAYQEFNAKVIDRLARDGWIWGKPIEHSVYAAAREGCWDVVLTPTKPVPHEWFGDLKGKKLLGLASGGGQQMPVFAACGAECTLLDYSEKQLESDAMVAAREGYAIELVRADMTKPLPFADESFDIVFHPASNCFVEKVEPIWRECFRVLRRGGCLLSGVDNGINFLFEDNEREVVNALPYNPLRDSKTLRKLKTEGKAIEFSHTLEEQLGGQLRAGFRLTDLYEDTNGDGRLHELNVPCFIAVRAVKD